jgi:error-prone DNA polymerase
MVGLCGQVQREGEVIHVVVQRLDDLSDMLSSVGDRTDVASVYPVSRADVVKNSMAPDPRDPAERGLGRKPRELYDPDLRLGSGIIPDEPTDGIKIRPRNFR